MDADADRPRSRKELTVGVLSILAVTALASASWLLVTRGTGHHSATAWFNSWPGRDIALALGMSWLGLIVACCRISRRAAFRALFAHLLAALILALLETAGFVGLVDYRKVLGEPSGPPLGSVRLIHADVRGEAEPDIAKILGIAHPRIPFHFRTDQRGFRNAVDRESAEIYLLGDSFIVGGFIPFEETLAARLESALERPVMNIALTDLGAQDERDLFLPLDLLLTDRLVLHFIFEGNDLKASARYVAGRPRSVLDPVSPWKTTLTYQLPRHLRRRTRGDPDPSTLPSGRFGSKDIYFHWTGDDVIPYESEIPAVFGAIDDLDRYVRGQGGCYAVVFIPMKLRVLGPYCVFRETSPFRDLTRHLGLLPEKLRAGCAERGIPFADLTEALTLSARDGTLPYHLLDTHWSASGHAVAAKVLAPFARPPVASTPK